MEDTKRETNKVSMPGTDAQWHVLRPVPGMLCSTAVDFDHGQEDCYRGPHRAQTPGPRGTSRPGLSAVLRPPFLPLRKLIRTTQNLLQTASQTESVTGPWRTLVPATALWDYSWAAGSDCLGVSPK